MNGPPFVSYSSKRSRQVAAQLALGPRKRGRSRVGAALFIREREAARR
jgi:hypothetical protein